MLRKGKRHPYHNKKTGIKEMTPIDALDAKILHLQKKKEDLYQSLQKAFFKRLYNHVGTHMPLETLLGFFVENWINPSPQDLQRWQQQGEAFFRLSPFKKASKASQTPGSFEAQKAS